MEVRSLYTVALLVTVILSVISAVPLNSLLTTAPTQEPHLMQQISNNELPRVTLIKLWSVTHGAYMAKFVGEKYIVVFDTHGDVSLDNKYISSRKSAWIYKVDTGELLGTLTSDVEGEGDTWQVISWEPFQAVKVWNRAGFFSADSKRMVEDVYEFGTDAKAVDTTTWITIPIDWGFTDTTEGHFYAVQLDYSGSYLFVGRIAYGTFYIYKYDPEQGKYVLFFVHQESGNYGRRAQMTLDGKYIVVGGLDYGYLDIWERVSDEPGPTSFVRVVHYELPDVGGLGSLGISDPYNVGYIIGGTKNGWVIIAYFNATTKEFKVVYQAKEAPDGSWLYNPFYDRWIPKVTEVFALCSLRVSSRPGYGIVYDVLTNQTVVIHFADPGSPQWSAAAVSPEANYVFLGNALYMVVKRDIHSGQPRVRLWGSIEFHRDYQSLSEPLVFTAPTRDYHLYFYSGRVTVKRLHVESVTVDLIENPDFIQGRLTRLYEKGLIYASTISAKHVEVRNLSIVTGEDVREIMEGEGIKEVENYIATVSSLHFVPPAYIEEGHAWYGSVIYVPLDVPLSIYDDITMQLSASIRTELVFYNKTKRVLGILGFPVEIGGGVGVSAPTFAKIAWKVADWYGCKYGISLGKAAAIALAQPVAKVVGIVGIAMAGWGLIDSAIVYFRYGDIVPRSWIVIAPVIVDRYGNRYSAVKFVVPLEASEELGTYYNLMRQYFKERGYTDVGFSAHFPCETWDEYRDLLAGGYAPPVDLEALVEDTIASKYGLNMTELRIVGVDVFIVTALKVRETFWEWLFGVGGVDAYTVTLVGAATVSVKGKLKARTVTDPSEIASLLGKVAINNVDFNLLPGTEGAYTDFAFNLGVEGLAIDFGMREGYFADIDITVDVAITKNFQPLGSFAYIASFHYDWFPQVRLWKIELVDMPHPMYRVERIYEYSYGTFTSDMTFAFALISTVESNVSPTGMFYYYVASDPRYFDPANGGLLQPCERFTIKYFYAPPPDAGIKILLNGTKRASTLPHHATVVISSYNAEQDVVYGLTIKVKYLRGLTEVAIDLETFTEIVHVGNNSRVYRIYDITPYVEEAISYMNATGERTFIELIAKIYEAEYNYMEYNDEDEVDYYPPPTIPPPIPVKGNASVVVKVYEYAQLEEGNFTRRPSANATVKAYYGYTIGAGLMYTNVTDENGTTTFVLPVGTWTFVASKPGYLDDFSIVSVYANNTPVILLLSPISKPSRENRTYVSANATTTFFIYDGRNANPVSNANVTARLIEPTDSPYYNKTFTAITDSTGHAYMALPLGRYEVTVNASGYRLYRSEYVIDKDRTINIALIPETLVNFGSLRIIVIYSDWKPYEGAHVEVRNATDGSLIAVLSTNSFGNATLTLPLYQVYNVSVHVVEPLYGREYFDYDLVNLTESDIAVPFVVPWESPQPPIPVEEFKSYWLTVQVVWSNGLPFHGANVSVFNYTSGELIDSVLTNGTGTAHFLLSAFKMYKVTVEAVNPYTSEVYRNSYVLNLTENIWKEEWLPWSPPKPVEKKYRLIIFAYDITTGKGVEGVQVVVNKGETGTAWTAYTNTTGYAEVYVPFLGLYNVTGIHRDYEPIFREIYVVENNTPINLPLSPVLIPSEVPPPPLNATEYPPIVVKEVNNYWLSVQVLWKDGFPFQKALVTVYNLTDGSVMFQMDTNGTGFVHFLIPENASIKVTVNATHPQDPSLTFYDERELNMTQHYFISFTVPWESEYQASEVWLKEVHFVIHRGQGYYFGNVSHLALLKIWTNKPQNVTVHLELINASTNATVTARDVTLSLEEGLNTFFEWLEVNASKGGYFRFFANITQWEYDTDPTNNWAWSETQYLKPMVDIQVFILWRPVEQKQRWSLLPEDIIEIDIGVKLPINTSSKPARISWRIEKYNLKNLIYDLERGAEEEVRVVKPSTIWRNITVVVPWTSKLVVTANATHEWEDFGFNNFVNVTIKIDPDVKIALIDAPSLITEGQPFKVVVNLTSNVEPGGGIGWVTLEDNTTHTLLVREEIELAPQKTLELSAKAPENPTMFWFLHLPTTEHLMMTQFAGYDLYLGNNRQEFTLRVISYQWVAIIAIIVVIITIFAVIRAVTHTIATIATERRRFVRRRRFVKRRE